MGLWEDGMGHPQGVCAVPPSAGDFDTRGPTGMLDTDYMPSCTRAHT